MARWIAIVSIACVSIATAQPAGKRGDKRRPWPDPAPQIALLASTDVELAAKAAAELGANNDPAAHDALLDALALGVPAGVATAAIAALAQHPAPADVGALRRYAVHRDGSVRAAALAALARYPDPAARAAIAMRLRDTVPTVREAAADAAARGHVRDAIEPLIALLARGEDAAAKALAELADADLARKLGDQLGKAPDAVLARCLGMVLARSDFGPDAERVEVVRAIAKIHDPAAVAALTAYLQKAPKTPPRASRAEAEHALEAMR